MSAPEISTRSQVRPQALMLSFMGLYMRGHDSAVYTGSLIDVFRRVGVSEDAVRSTVSRMAKRGLLSRHPRGRKVYVGLTAEARSILEDGHRRVWETGAVDEDWDGQWTWVAFSMPDERRNERHDLRSRLVWAGFGPLQGGLWIAPGRRALDAVLGSLEVNGQVHVLTGTVPDPADATRMIETAFDLDAIAGRYEDFLSRWGARRPAGDLPDDLARQLVLHNDWLELVRRDPILPAEHLPPAWPAIRAQELFHRLAADLHDSAGMLAATVVEVIPA